MILLIEFGSVARRHLDSSSDRDLLLVGDDGSTLLDARTKCKQAGHSVSWFTLETARYSASHGSLFFKHIELDGRLIYGDENAFEDLISIWRAPKNYENELLATRELLSLLLYVPKSQQGLLIATDLLVNCIRSGLIRHFASQGLYIFSWSDLVNTAVAHGLISPFQRNAILQARWIKNQYRRGLIPVTSLDLIHSMLSAAQIIFQDIIPLRFAVPAILDRYSESLPDRSYIKLRSLELLRAAHGNDIGFAPILPFIREPARFCRSPRATWSY